MISLLLLPLLLLPSIQGQTCDMAGVEERMEEKMARMEERMEEMVEERVEERVARMEEKMKEEMEAKMEGKEAVLRKELASKEELVSAVSQGLRDRVAKTLVAW